jgi:hypothetical protein
MIVIARSDRDEAIHFPRAQLAGNSSFTSVTTRLQPKFARERVGGRRERATEKWIASLCSQ